eukprot:s849_g25.t1
MAHSEKKPAKKEETSSEDEESKEEEKEEEPEVPVKSKAAAKVKAAAAPAGCGKGAPLSVAPGKSAPAVEPVRTPPAPPPAPHRRGDSEETEEAERAPRARALQPPRSPSPCRDGATPKHGGTPRSDRSKGAGKGATHVLEPALPGMAIQKHWLYGRHEAEHAAQQLKQERIRAYETSGVHIAFPDDPFYGSESAADHRGSAHAARNTRGAHEAPQESHHHDREMGSRRRRKRTEARVDEAAAEEHTRVRETRMDERAAEEHTRVRETRKEKKTKEIRLMPAKKEKSSRKAEKHRKDEVEYVLVPVPKKRKQNKMLLVSSSPSRSPQVLRRKRKGDDGSDHDEFLDRMGPGTYVVRGRA